LYPDFAALARSSSFSSVHMKTAVKLSNTLSK
jgi:hypothetical protein